jgi:hypothetical protein
VTVGVLFLPTNVREWHRPTTSTTNQVALYFGTYANAWPFVQTSFTGPNANQNVYLNSICCFIAQIDQEQSLRAPALSALVTYINVPAKNLSGLEPIFLTLLYANQSDTTGTTTAFAAWNAYANTGTQGSFPIVFYDVNLRTIFCPSDAALAQTRAGLTLSQVTSLPEILETSPTWSVPMSPQTSPSSPPILTPPEPPGPIPLDPQKPTPTEPPSGRILFPPPTPAPPEPRIPPIDLSIRKVVRHPIPSIPGTPDTAFATTPSVAVNFVPTPSVSAAATSQGSGTNALQAQAIKVVYTLAGAVSFALLAPEEGTICVIVGVYIGALAVGLPAGMELGEFIMMLVADPGVGNAGLTIDSNGQVNTVPLDSDSPDQPANPAQPDPSQPDPSQPNDGPNPSQPNPSQPNDGPNPTQPDPTRPDPSQPDPSQPDPNPSQPIDTPPILEPGAEPGTDPGTDPTDPDNGDPAIYQ